MYGTTVRIFIFDILITVRIMPCSIPVSKPVIDLTFAPTSPQHIPKGTLALLLHLSDQPSTGSSNLAGVSGKEYQYRTLKRGMSKIRKRDPRRRLWNSIPLGQPSPTTIHAWIATCHSTVERNRSSVSAETRRTNRSKSLERRTQQI